MTFKRETIMTTLNMLDRIGHSYPSKDSAIVQIVSFISVVMDLSTPGDLQRDLSFSAYPSLSHCNGPTRRWMVTRKFAFVFFLLHRIWQTIDALLLAEPQTPQFDGKIEGARGICFAVALGHVSEASLRPNFAMESVIDGIPGAFISGRHNPGLESLFETIPDLPLPTLDALKRGLHQFGKLCQALIQDDTVMLLIDSLKIRDPLTYSAIVLEELSRCADGVIRTVFYSGITTTIESEITISFQLEIPRQLRTRRSMRIMCPSETGPAVFWNSVFREQQQAMLGGRTGVISKASRRPNEPTGAGARLLEFRLGPHGVEFRCPAMNVMAHV
jgi:hypothetical protein